MARMEVCVDSVESAINAEKGGACRVELCSNLMEGGTTPSSGMLKVVKKSISIPVFVMLRPRGGDFLYSLHEFTVMKEDLLMLKSLGADGVVFGILTKNGDIDLQRCQELQAIAKPLPVTFHRAFDMVQDPMKSLEDLICLGIERLLTSGLDSTALEGLPMIMQLISKAKQRIIIMPGGGITERNLQRIIQGTGAKEFHCSARDSSTSHMEFKNSHVFMGAALRPAEFSIKITSETRVKRFVDISSE